MIEVKCKKQVGRGTWLAYSGEHGALDLRVLSSSPLGMQPTLKKKRRKKRKSQSYDNILTM